MARPEKASTVKEISERFEASDAALLTEYRGLSVSDMAEVRGALRDTDTDYKVLKNTLARIAVKEVGLEDLVEMLQGPTAIAFIRGDAAAAAKALDEAARKFPVLEIKGGVLDGKIISAEQAKQLAKLEPREVQLTTIAIMLNSPAQQAVNVLSALLRDAGSLLTQLLAQKEPEEAPNGPGEAGGAPEPEDVGAQVAAGGETPAEQDESSDEDDDSSTSSDDSSSDDDEAAQDKEE